MSRGIQESDMQQLTCPGCGGALKVEDPSAAFAKCPYCGDEVKLRPEGTPAPQITPDDVRKLEAAGMRIYRGVSLAITGGVLLVLLTIGLVVLHYTSRVPAAPAPSASDARRADWDRQFDQANKAVSQLQDTFLRAQVPPRPEQIDLLRTQNTQLLATLKELSSQAYDSLGRWKVSQIISNQQDWAQCEETLLKCILSTDERIQAMLKANQFKQARTLLQDERQTLSNGYYNVTMGLLDRRERDWYWAEQREIAVLSAKKDFAAALARAKQVQECASLPEFKGGAASLVADLQRKAAAGGSAPR